MGLDLNTLRTSSVSAAGPTSLRYVARNPHFCYNRYNTDGQNTEIRYATRNNGVWEKQVVAEEATSCDVKIGSDDEPRILYLSRDFRPMFAEW